VATFLVATCRQERKGGGTGSTGRLRFPCALLSDGTLWDCDRAELMSGADFSAHSTCPCQCTSIFILIEHTVQQNVFNSRMIKTSAHIKSSNANKVQ